MRKTEIIKQNEALQKSLYAQFIVIYGIMVGIAVVSYIATISKWPQVTSSELESIFVNSFVPTTITLLATALFEYEFVRKSKTVMAVYIMLTVTMSLFYTMFVCFEVLQASQVATTVSAIIASVITSFSFALLWWMVSRLNLKIEKRDTAVSDGHICAVRRK